MTKRSVNDDGSQNWSSKELSFDQWLALDRAPVAARRVETLEELRRRVSQDPRNFEPEWT